MNREIKFRVWDDMDKMWQHDKGYLSVSFNRDGEFFPFETGYGNFSYKNRFIIQQYTGLDDKNGRNIYEGDIVKVLDDNNIFDIRFGKVKRNVVGFDTNVIYPVEIGCFYFHRDGFPYFSITDNYLGKHDLEDTEIIGNIFENKELLE